MAYVDPQERLASVKAFGEHGGVNGSIEVSTTFTVLHADTLPAIFQGEKGPTNGCYVYGRSFNPTVRALAKQLAALEDMETAYATSSGMAAISCALLALCNSGDHIVASNTVYGGSFAFLKSFLPQKCNISTTFVDITDLQAVKAAIRPNTKVVYTETVSNPTLVVAPLHLLADLAHAAQAKLVVDNTFTPCIITPKHHGADVVVHSMTKFMSGASDVIAGAVCGSREFVTSLMDFHTGPMMLLGPTMDPRIASELTLRLPHLGLRMQEHSRRALAMAQGLHALGAKVTYPGLPSHPQYELLRHLANPGYGFGGLLGLDLGGKAAADGFMERLQNKHAFGYMAVSLGYFDTLMSASAASTSSELDPTDMAASGISNGYVRMSVGITGSLEQRWAQLEEAYLFIAKGGANAPYRATKMQATEGGVPGSLLTWPSLGSETCLDSLDEQPSVLPALLAPTALTGTMGPSLTFQPSQTTSIFTAAAVTDLFGPAGDSGVVASSGMGGAVAGGSGSGEEGGPRAATSPLKVLPGTVSVGRQDSPTHAKLKIRRTADGVDIQYVPRT